eukprot:3563350-Rhodomonas_salina.1
MYEADELGSHRPANNTARKCITALLRSEKPRILDHVSTAKPPRSLETTQADNFAQESGCMSVSKSPLRLETVFRGVVRGALQQELTYAFAMWSPVLTYAFAMRSPVLTCGMLLPVGGERKEEKRTQKSTFPGTDCYRADAMCGTELGYQDVMCGTAVGYQGGRMHCAVLVQRIRCDEEH